MGNSKARAIQVDFGIFLLVLTYSGIIRVIQELLRHIQNPVTLAYSEPLYNQNPSIVRTRGFYLMRFNQRFLLNPDVFT